MSCMPGCKVRRLHWESECDPSPRRPLRGAAEADHLASIARSYVNRDATAADVAAAFRAFERAAGITTTREG